MEKSSKISKAKQRGFTLFETLVYVGILAMITMGMVSYILSLSAAGNKNHVIQDVQANGRTALEIMSEKIRSCDSVVAPAAGASGNQLVLDVPGTSNNITFSVSGGRLLMTQPGSSDIYLTDSRISVTNLVFTNTAYAGGRDNINIQANISSNNTTGTDNAYTESLRTSSSRRK